MSKTKQTTTQSQTMTPTNPEWSTQANQGLSDRITSLSGQDPASFFAGASGLQNQQFDLASLFGGKAGGYLDSAAGMAQGLGSYSPQQVQGAQVADPSQVQASTAYGGIPNYMNPYEQLVINSGLADNEQARQMARMDTADAFTKAKAFGGSRQGVENAQTNSAYDRNAQSFIGNLRNQGFNTALQYANADAERAQGAGYFNASAQNANNLANAGFGQQAGLANQSAGLQGAGLNQQGQLGGAQLLQSLGLSGYDALSGAGATQQGLNQNLAGAPLAVLQGLSGANSGINYGIFSGSNSTGNGTATQNAGLGGILQGLGGLAGGLGSMGLKLSDARLKTDVEYVSTDAKGRRWYDYRYIGDPTEAIHRGVMAQEVMHTDPQAIGYHPAGFLMVDYSKLEG